MKLRWHLLALVLVAFAVGLLFLQEPGFGDDLTYWSFAFDLHERGLIAWQKGSFHDLRWPVWGVSWLLQAAFGPGLLSYYGVPLLYLAAGAMLAFAFARRAQATIGTAWAAGLAFLFHPLLDTVCYRPMPDLSEGVIGAAIMLCWWELMRAETRGRSVLFAALTGAGIFVIEANRVTGVFIVPVLILGTLFFFPRRFGWLVVAGACSAALYVAECGFYKWLFSDWFHDLTANAGNKGAKGTQAPPFWYLPFRFFDTLWKGNPLAPLYCITALIGVWAAWFHRGLVGRVVVVWFGALYLMYACAPQSFAPWRPLVRDADRFLAALAVPMSVLAAIGLSQLVAWLWSRFASAQWANRRARYERIPLRGLLIGAATVALVALITSREFFSIGLVPKMRSYLAALPTGTKVFSHKGMREFVHLVAARDAGRFAWFAPNEILHADPRLEALAAQCTEFWYARKLVWLNTRKQLEKGKLTEPPPLGSYFAHPEREWRLADVFVKEDTPDLVFHRRRTADDPPPAILEASAPDFADLLPALPAAWAQESGRSTFERMWKIPESLRGRLVRVEVDAASPQVEACTLRLRFSANDGRARRAEYLLKPYLYSAGGREFFAMRLPANADACQIQLKFSKNAKRAELTSFRVVVEPAR